jgi:hypothetical protein
MDAPHRGALMLVRFIAVALLGASIVELSLYWVVSSAHHVSVDVFICVLKSIPAVAGLVVLIKSRAIANWLANKLDE